MINNLNILFPHLKNPYTKSIKNNSLDILWEEKAAWAGSGAVIGRNYIGSSGGPKYIMAVTTSLKDGTILSDEIKYC